MIGSFTRCWARDFSWKYGCTVNTVAPGPVGTASLLSWPQELLDQLKIRSENVAAGSHLAHLEEIVWTVATLCEEQAGWLNGLYILVTGSGTLL